MGFQERIVHCKREPFDIYIGRPGKWGNPFVIGKDGTREEVITKYREYVLKNPHLLSSLHELEGKILGCWCYPKPCHGEVLLELMGKVKRKPFKSYNHLCVFDFETGGKDRRTCEIIQIGACIIDRRSLRIVDEFETLCKPLDFDALEQEALDINKKTKEELQAAPEMSFVWPQFVDWVNKYNISKGTPNPFSAPIAAGYNIVGYDLPITTRYCEKYGPFDEVRGEQKLFNQVLKYDLMDHLWFWTENLAEVTSLKLEDMCRYFGFPEEAIAGSHDALQDVRNCAIIIQRFLRVQRHLTQADTEGRSRLQMRDWYARHDKAS